MSDGHYIKSGYNEELDKLREAPETAISGSPIWKQKSAS